MKKNYFFIFSICLSLIPIEGVAQAKISILGDSYSTYEGYLTPDSNLTWYANKSKYRNDVHDVNLTWWKLLLNALKGELVVNNSYSGSTICNTGYYNKDVSKTSYIARMSNIGTPDILIIFGGTNDCWAHVPLGKFKYEGWTHQDLKSFRPAFCYLLYHLSKEHPKMKIINVCNSNLTGDYNRSMAEICKRYNVTCIELENISKQHSHPSIVGMRQIADQLRNILESYIKEAIPNK